MDKLILPKLTPEQEEKMWLNKALGFYAMFTNSKEEKEHTVAEIQELWSKEEEKTQKAWVHVTQLVERAMVQTINELQLVQRKR